MFPSFEDEFMAPSVRRTLEASFCGFGCESENDCTHAPSDEDEQDAIDMAWAEQFERNYNAEYGDWYHPRYGRI